MGNKKTIECHNCESEIVILDKYDDIDIEKLLYCPFCGSDNVEAKSG